jgi:hypothetical protein
MNPTLLGLVMEAVQSKNWSWDPGMRVLGEGGKVGTITGFKSLRTRGYVDVSWDDGKALHTKIADIIPLASEPTTRVLILEMARKAWNTELVASTADGWYVNLPDFESPSLWRVVEAPTEEEVILQAFLQAPIGAAMISLTSEYDGEI